MALSTGAFLPWSVCPLLPQHTTAGTSEHFPAGHSLHPTGISPQSTPGGPSALLAISSAPKAPGRSIWEPYLEALASGERHTSGQAALLRPPGVLGLCVPDHGVLIKPGVQVEGNVVPGAQVDVETKNGQLMWVSSALSSAPTPNPSGPQRSFSFLRGLAYPLA